MSNSASAIVALVVGLFIGIGLGIALARLSGAKNPSLTSQVELAKATAELTGAQTMLAEYKSQIDGERAKSDATIKLNAELEAMKTRVEELNRISVDADRRRVGAEAEIKTQITQMAAHNENLVNQTRAIAGALASSQTRGKYGEAALEQLLEGAGLIEGEHFTRQRSAEKTETSGAIPDITINMPGGSVLYIDSKFPFERFYEAFETEDQEIRKELLLAHTKDLLKHIEALAKRKYAQRGPSPDFVILYAPVDSIFTQALKSDTALLDKAFALGVTIATPTSMMALLRTVGYLFSRNRVATNAAEIQELAAKFLKDVSSLHEKIVTVGDRLKSTLKAYNELIPTAETTVLSAAKKMRALDVPGKSPKAIPELSENVRTLHSKLAPSDDDYIDADEVELALELDDLKDLEDNN
jgi:DNA recombination protein RmuC